ncbi:NADPH:quinone reductase [Actinorhabdospora filicis]|uniref:NADPH:quinone reductase n=1 Tax=Actinorhabdospora filicis TaxID=1785913 RepID=A0A9W6SS88_9ACTN|nr:NADP-dependent oxidoreductase [Actinorhabdospora filicis]GLZ81015.1 NADPH:quinone reductase [Actinorhabdospora filicis]
MKAVVMTGDGPSVTEVDRPEPGPVEVLVRVHAASVNPADVKGAARGSLPDGTPMRTPGWDVSGVVEEVGRGVQLYKPGDEVFGMIRFPHAGGTFAEYVTAPPRHLVRKPAALDHVRAAALPLVSLTAWQALVDTAGLRPGQRVLIHAAAGGVGHVAVQLAKELGAVIIGTASAAKHEFVTNLGADRMIDYTAEDFGELRNVDVVLDTVGGDYAARSLPVLREGGTLVNLVPSGVTELPAHVRGGFLLVEPDHDDMGAVARFAAKGHLRAEIDTVLPLDRVREAMARVESGRARGKVVLTAV